MVACWSKNGRASRRKNVYRDATLIIEGFLWFSGYPIVLLVIIVGRLYTQTTAFTC